MLHAIRSRDQVTGEWVTRCGRKGLRDTGKLPLGSPRAAARYGTSDPFETATAERYVDCPGCILMLTAEQRRTMRVLYQLGSEHVVAKPGSLDWNDAVKPPVLWAEPA